MSKRYHSFASTPNGVYHENELKFCFNLIRKEASFKQAVRALVDED